MRSPSPEAVVLVHDDALRQFISYILEQQGLKVYATSSAEKALDYIRAHRPAVVLCKHRRGLIDCVKVCSQIRAEGATTPVVLLTSDGSTALGRRFQQAGCSAWLSLPFDAEALKEVVAPYVAAHRGMSPPAVS